MLLVMASGATHWEHVTLSLPNFACGIDLPILNFGTLDTSKYDGVGVMVYTHSALHMHGSVGMLMKNEDDDDDDDESNDGEHPFWAK